MFWKLLRYYLFLLAAIFVVGVMVAWADPSLGEQILRNGFYYAVVFPVAVILASIAWALGVAHESGSISGPQLLGIMWLLVIGAIFFGVVRGLWKKASGIFGGGGGAAHH